MENLSLDIVSDDLLSDWNRCSEISHYLSSYVANDFGNPDRALNIISVVSNELLEYLFESAKEGGRIFIVLSLDLEDEKISIACKSSVKDNCSVAEYLKVTEKHSDDEQDEVSWLLSFEKHEHFRFAFLRNDYGCEFESSLNDDYQEVVCRIHITS